VKQISVDQDDHCICSLRREAMLGCRVRMDMILRRTYNMDIRLDALIEKHCYQIIFTEHASMPREFSILIERDDEGFYVATVPELRGCHTQAKSLDTLMKRVREAIDLCLEVEQELPSPSQFIGVQRIVVEV
jgi:predicted RNase H-like HicB family nuclease